MKGFRSMGKGQQKTELRRGHLKTPSHRKTLEWMLHKRCRHAWMNPFMFVLSRDDTLVHRHGQRTNARTLERQQRFVFVNSHARKIGLHLECLLEDTVDLTGAFDSLQTALAQLSFVPPARELDWQGNVSIRLYSIQIKTCWELQKPGTGVPEREIKRLGFLEP